MEINLGSIITNAFARKLIYAIYFIAGLILGAIQAAFGAMTGTPIAPEWLTVALAVYGYLGIPVGVLAVANTPDKVAVADAIKGSDLD